MLGALRFLAVVSPDVYEPLLYAQPTWQPFFVRTRPNGRTFFSAVVELNEPPGVLCPRAEVVLQRGVPAATLCLQRVSMSAAVA
jgi:hypothetical protein